MDVVEPLTRDRLDRWTHAVGEHFLPCVRPIYAAKRSGIPDQVGSCVLVRMAGRRYLVTAAHVADFIDSSTLLIGGEKKLVEITWGFHVTQRPKGDRRLDHYDFAISSVSDEIALALGEVSYVDARAIARNRHSKDGHFYIAFGYPNTRNRKLDVVRRHVPAKAFRHTSQAVDDPPLSKRLGVSGNDHLFVAYEKYVSTGKSKRSKAIKPKGFSGGALIELDVGSCFAGSPRGRLAGIITARSSGKRAKIVATKIQVILASIRN